MSCQGERSDTCFQDTLKPSLGAHHLFPTACKESRFPAPKNRKAAALDGIEYKTVLKAGIRSLPEAFYRNLEFASLLPG